MLENANLGTINMDTYSAGGYGNEFDSKTIIGAFEHLITNIQKFMPGAKIIFFSLYKLRPDTTDLAYATQRQTWDMLKQGCEKYAVKYVDLYKEGNFNPHTMEHWNAYMGDWVHINEAGYRRLWPPIRAALRDV